MNKWVLAVVSFVLALGGAAGVTAGLDAGQLTVGVLVAAALSAFAVGTGKLYDPGHVLAVPRVVKALAFGIIAGGPLFEAAIGAASPGGAAITGQEWGGIGTAFLLAAWAKWSTPDKITA